eukprot:306908-Amphidinium_carterae.1
MISMTKLFLPESAKTLARFFSRFRMAQPRGADPVAPPQDAKPGTTPQGVALRVGPASPRSAS